MSYFRHKPMLLQLDYQRQETNFHDGPDSRIGRDFVANVDYIEAGTYELCRFGIKAA